MKTPEKFILELFVLFIFIFITSFAFADNEILVNIDPPDRLMNKILLGEWATDSNLEDWLGNNISGLTSTDGYITGMATADNFSIQKTGLNGPELGFGFFDYLQIRIKVPASFNTDIVFSFGTSVNPGFAQNRQLRINNSDIPKDSNWHTYRLDLGLVVWWRDTLSDIKISFSRNFGIGQSFFIDYIETGDLPGDVLLINTDLGLAEGETFKEISFMESKHAVFWWSPASFVVDPALNPNVMGRRALRMLEESYQVYCKKLGFKEPFESWDLWRRDGNRFKVNLTTWFGGFWMGGRNGFGWVNVPASGLWDEGWGNPLPHEFAHVIDSHQINFLTGGHWESHANYLRQAWQLHYAERFPNDQQSQLDLQIYELSNLHQDHGRLIYRDFRIHQALQDYADDMGLNFNIEAQLWFDGQKEMTVYEKLETLLPQDYRLEDIVAFGLRHWPFLDFEDGDKFRNQLWSTPDNKAWHDYVTGSLLIPCQDKLGWWRIPFERAPERFAYMYHELTPTDSNVTVEFNGFDVIGDTEGWRWSLAAINSDNKVRFSELWESGSHSMLLNHDEIKLFIVVVATPSEGSLNLEYPDNRIHPDKHYERLRYAYEIRIENAIPTPRQLDWNTSSGYHHSNGGGWVANTSSVSRFAYVGPKARVLGNAKVYDNARIEDYAVITENAIICDNAVVSGYAVVRNNAIVRDNAKIRDRAILQDNCIIDGNGLVEDFSHIHGSTNVTDNAIARGVSMPWDSVISGTAIVDYDFSNTAFLSDGVHFSHIPWGDWYKDYYMLSKKKPRGLVASYRIEEPEGQVCWDEFGAQHAFLRGVPQRVADITMNSNVLRFDGIDDYMVLDRSLCDAKEATYAIWCKPEKGDINESLLFMGKSKDTYIKIIARDSEGHARVIYSWDGSQTEVVSSSVVPTDKWTHIAIVFQSDGSCLLYINGVQEGQHIMNYPYTILGSNDYSAPEAFYIGRDWYGNLFKGDIEDARFYNVPLTPDEIANEMRRRGDIIGVFYYNFPTDFDGSSTEALTGVHNGLERVLQASIYPDTSDDVDYYEGILDCTDERNSSYEGTGFGLDDMEILVRLENVGFWRTGIYIKLKQWQKITVAFNGKIAKLYIDNVLKASRTYSAAQSDVAGKNYRIGFAMDSQSNKYHFDGQIKDIYISDRFNINEEDIP